MRHDGVEPPESKHLVYSQARYPYGLMTHVPLLYQDEAVPVKWWREKCSHLPDSQVMSLVTNYLVLPAVVVEGIEPSILPYEGNVIPFNYTTKRTGQESNPRISAANSLATIPTLGVQFMLLQVGWVYRFYHLFCTPAGS